MEALSPYYYIKNGETVFDAYSDDHSYYRKVCLCELLPCHRDDESAAEETSKIDKSSEDAADEKK